MDRRTKLEEMLTCPVCQDIFTDPRQLPCGHSICMGCLENMMDHSSGIPFRCPDCRGYFGAIIGVQKSYTLVSIAEEYRLSRKRRDELTKSVNCDCCLEKNPAFKTCLKCEVSLCKQHIKDHLELPAFTGHPLVKPLGDLQERKCPEHKDEVLRYYCKSSRRYICNMCALESKQHDLATETSNVLRRQLTEYMDQCFKMIKDQMSESNDTVKKLQKEIRDDKERAKPANSSLNCVTVLLLCLWFIVLYYAYNYSVENQALTVALNKQQTRVHHIYSTIAELLVKHQKRGQMPSVPEEKGMLMLDVDTVSPFLGVSADLLTVERVKTKLSYPSSKSRFDEAPQVLSAECFVTGTHFWEVEAEGYWDIAVSYKSIQRKSRNSAFGNNAESWSLTHNGKGKLFAYHNKGKTILSGTWQSTRIAVMVSFERGSITFSTVEPKAKLLHEFKAELTQPLCLGLGLYRVDPYSKASIVKAF